MFVIFRNNLNEFWDFCNGINMGADSHKAISFVASPYRLRLLGACLFKSSRKVWYLIQEMLKLEILISSF